MYDTDPSVPTLPLRPRRAGPSRLTAVALGVLVAITGVAVAPAAGSAPAGSTSAGSDDVTGGLPFAQVMDATSPVFTEAMSKRILGHGRPVHDPPARQRLAAVAPGDPDRHDHDRLGGPEDRQERRGEHPARHGELPALLHAPLRQQDQRDVRVSGRSSKTPGTSDAQDRRASALGIEIDAYALVGFAAFRKLVNNVGGLRVYVAKTFYDFSYSIKKGRRGFGLKKGWHTVRDLVALAFARTRHADSDYARARRQQQLVVAAVTKVKSRGLVRSRGAHRGEQGADQDRPPAHLRPAHLDDRRSGERCPRQEDRVRADPVRLLGRWLQQRPQAVGHAAWIKKYFPTIHKNATWLPPVPTPTHPVTEPRVRAPPHAERRARARTDRRPRAGFPGSQASAGADLADHSGVGRRDHEGVVGADRRPGITLVAPRPGLRRRTRPCTGGDPVRIRPFDDRRERSSRPPGARCRPCARARPPGRSGRRGSCRSRARPGSRRDPRAPRASRSGCSTSRGCSRRPCRRRSLARNHSRVAARSAQTRRRVAAPRDRPFHVGRRSDLRDDDARSAPASSACMIRTGSLAATRYRTGTPAARVAMSIATRSLVATAPCSPSAMRRSNPAPAMSSVAAGSRIVSHVPSEKEPRAPAARESRANGRNVGHCRSSAAAMAEAGGWTCRVTSLHARGSMVRVHETVQSGQPTQGMTSEYALSPMTDRPPLSAGHAPGA